MIGEKTEHEQKTKHEKKTKQELTEYCRKNNIKHFSNKSKDDLISHIIQIETFKKCFKRILENNFMVRMELENDRQALIDKEEEEEVSHNDSLIEGGGLKVSSLGDDLERVQLEQALEVTSNIVPRESLEEILNPRASDSEIQSYMDELKGKFPCSTFDYEHHDNPYRDGSYKRHKQNIYQSTKSLGEHGEKLLVHGTDETCIKPILDDDFSLTSRSTHGNRLGKGIYFTDKIPLACRYSEREYRKKYLILCKVHVGNIMKGDGRGILDKMPNSDYRYDTIVEKFDDNIENTDQFNKVKNNTYSIQGIITVTINDEESSLLKYYSSMYSSKYSSKYSTKSTNLTNLTTGPRTPAEHLAG